MTAMRRKLLLSATALLTYAVLSILPLSSAEEDQAALGTEALRDGDIELAVGRFRRSMDRPGSRAEKNFNLGTALARATLRAVNGDERARKLSASLATLSQASREADKDPMLQAAALYNRGTLELMSGRNQESISLLRRALLVDPTSEKTRHNLELALLAQRSEAVPSKSRSSGKGMDGKAAKVAKGADASQSGDRAKDSQAGPSSQDFTESGKSGIGAEASHRSDRDSGQGKGQPSLSPSDSVPSFGQSPRPRDTEDLGLQQKLDALERRSGELHRSGLLRKSKERANSFRRGKQ